MGSTPTCATMIVDENLTEICECVCHRDGEKEHEFVRCCHLAYNKYISSTGELDMVRWAKIIRQLHNFGNIEYTNKIK